MVVMFLSLGGHADIRNTLSGVIRKSPPSWTAREELFIPVLTFYQLL